MRPGACPTLNEQTDPILQQAERDAEAIRTAAERDAEVIRREAFDAAQRLLDRLRALEFPLGDLVAELRQETDEVARQLEGGGQALESDPAASTGQEEPYAERAPVDERPSRPAAGGQEREGWQRWVAADKD